MPLKSGPGSFKFNLRELISSGRPKKQALAIAYAKLKAKKARKASKAKFPKLTAIAGTLALILVPSICSAQVISNPSRFLFMHDPQSRSETDTYKVGYFAVGASAPVHIVDVPKSSTISEGSEFSGSLPRPALGTWVIRLQACSGNLCSEWSNASDPFGLSPRPPVALRVAQ